MWNPFGSSDCTHPVKCDHLVTLSVHTGSSEIWHNISVWLKKSLWGKQMLISFFSSVQMSWTWAFTLCMIQSHRQMLLLAVQSIWSIQVVSPCNLLHLYSPYFFISNQSFVQPFIDLFHPTWSRSYLFIGSNPSLYLPSFISVKIIQSLTFLI